ATGAEGWGECVAMEEPLYSSEYVDGAAAVIRSHLVPRVFARGDLCAADIGPTLAAVKGHPMAKAALETAVLDAELRLTNTRLVEEDLLGHAKLARLIRTPVCLDESITSARIAEAAMELGACAIVNIKPGRVGGYLEAKRVHDVCAAHDVPVWCGGMLETGIGRAANVALAALPNFTLPGDTSASSRYFATDITEPFVLEDGRLRVPIGPGIGV